MKNIKEWVHHRLQHLYRRSKHQKEVKKTLFSIEGIEDIHDLQMWTITSGLDSLTCHVLIEDNNNEQDILQKVIKAIENKFGIAHTTIQIEKNYNIKN